MDALARADACLLVQPCGTSAHLELGYAIGAGKMTAVLYPFDVETPNGKDQRGVPHNPTGHTLGGMSEDNCSACDVQFKGTPGFAKGFECFMREKLQKIEPELMLRAAGEILVSRAELESWLRYVSRVAVTNDFGQRASSVEKTP